MTTDAQNSAFFDELPEHWDEAVEHDPKKLERVVEFLGLKPGERVLDVGCGTGVMVPYLLERVGDTGEIVAVDISPKMVAVAKRKFPPDEYPNVKFIAADVNETAPENEFDAVLCYSCFPHFKDRRASIRRLAHSLKGGGTMAVAHSESRDSINEMHADGPDEVRSDYLPPADETAEMMADAGLEVIEVIDDEDMFVVAARKRR